MKRKIFLTILVVLAVAAVIGYRLYSKKVSNYAEESPEITITAAALVQAFEADSAAASKRFSDKVVRVSGVVKSVDSSAVVLGEQGNPSDVVVGLDDRNLKGLDQLKPGSAAVLQGRFSGYNLASDDDLLASLGTTIKIDYAGIINKP